MSQLTLLTVDEPKQPPGVELRNCSVQDLLANMPGAPSLIVADPPWHYSQAPGHSANPENHYEAMSDKEIVAILDRAWDTMEAGRLVVWLTWPKLQDWIDAVEGSRWRWRYVSGGSWHKTGGSGTGYHWIGASELCLVFVKGTGLCTRWGSLTNAHTSRRQKHSEKPAGWMVEWLQRWTAPDDLICDLFAGMAPLGRAVAMAGEGRRYVGAELDPKRYREAVDKLALWRCLE